MAEPHRRVYVFAHPRSTSHLFYQLLSGHPSFKAAKPLSCMPAYRLGVDSQAALDPSKAACDAYGIDDETLTKVSWQNFVDTTQRNVAEAEAKGKRFLAMDHPYQLMPSSLVNSQLNIPERKTRPTPSVVDRKFDLAASPSGLGDDLDVRSNPTLIPDRFFFSFTPIITIRHPAHATPSTYRALREMGGEISNLDFPVLTSYKLTRLVFDSYKAYADSMEQGDIANVPLPIVVDGEKLVKDPQGQMKKVCDTLGLDEGGIRYNWDSPEMRKGTKLGNAFFKTLNESNGVVPNPKYDKPIDIESETVKWAQEWDEEIAKALRKRVEGDMEDYQYLLQYSV
ncbi:hypothetical protein AAF712_004612 [Marasmius tenuissimus]|uniref:Sulfotransferase n=1 Tax=Marasmius tenuissimus TaxID=585030 RepID=A0ABR3A4B0_9AGAR|nr:hypothetical protein PM082_021355 [Marasmius tenuissimus]